MYSSTETDLLQGLSSFEVLHLPKNTPSHHRTGFQLALGVLKNQIISFFFILLVASGALSLFLGHTVDASIFFAIAGINALIGFLQEYRANKSAEVLEQLVSHDVTVRRDGRLVKIPSTEVVLGDIVVCGPGDVIVADMIVRESKDVFLDESVRTGETLPRPITVGETLSGGSSIVQGTMLGQVTAVGSESSLLMYSEKVSTIEKSSSFEGFIHRISTFIIVLTALCLVLVCSVNVLVLHSITLPDYLLYAVSMLVGVVPESLPLIITLILTRESLALARNKVLVKKLSVLQNLGSMNYLFTDKTGTLTENNLHIKSVVDEGGLMESLALVSKGSYERTPMDTVFDSAIEKYLDEQNYRIDVQSGELILSPFQIARGYAVYTLPDGSEIIRGQYKFVSSVCRGACDSFQMSCLEEERQGLRVIALGKKAVDETSYTLLGAAVFEDPLKRDACDMYRAVEELGIKVKVITGDSVPVATYIGSKLDEDLNEGSVYSMDEWKGEHTDEIEQYAIYARCKPEQKSELIDEHLDHGVVGFLGEGINDALALKRADIGFVVSNASDVARQAGDVILLEKSLAPIRDAIRMSRKAFAHIRTYLLCTLAGNIGTLISLTVVVVLWQEIPMLPIQILLNNLLTDVPLMFLLADSISESLVRRPIRDEARKFFFLIFIFATLSSLFDFAFFFLFKGYQLEVLRTGWFVFSVLAELTLVFSLRSELSIFKSPKVARLLGWALVVCYVIALGLPFTTLGSVFHLVPLSIIQVLLIVGLTSVYLFGNEVLKWVYRRTQVMRA